MMRWLSEWWRGGTASVEPASVRDAARLAQLHGASFARGWGEGEFETMLSEMELFLDGVILTLAFFGPARPLFFIAR